MIRIYSLDVDYYDCVIEMGGDVTSRLYEGIIDVDFPDTVKFYTDNDGYFFTSPTVGMTLSSDEFDNIEII